MATPTVPGLGRSEDVPGAHAGFLEGPRGLCIETQSRYVMAHLVNDVVAGALRLGLFDGPVERVEKANGVLLRRNLDR